MPVSAAEFDPAFTYTLPPTWEVTSDSPRNYTLQATAAPTGTVILFRDVVAASPDCSDRPDGDVGTSSEAMTTWMATNPAFDATSPQRVNVGGATGYRVDLQQTEGWDQTCGLAEVPLVIGKPDGMPSWTVPAGARMRVFVLDLSDGGTVTIAAQTGDADNFERFMDEASHSWTRSSSQPDHPGTAPGGAAMCASRSGAARSLPVRSRGSLR